jgi:hypothetical protein
MKLLSVALVTVVVTASLSISKPAFADDALVVSICNFVAADDKNRLRKKMRSSKVKLRNIYDGVTCDGLNLLQFAMKKNAGNVGKYIVKRLPTSKLKSGDDLNWANSNGFGESEIVGAIKERAGL